MKIKIAIMLLMLIVTTKLKSQEYYNEVDEVKEKDVFINKNIKISTDTNYILKKYGKPLERIVTPDEEVGYKGGIDYKYDGIKFYYCREIEDIGTFSITNTKYSINIKNKEEIRVGDNLDKLKKNFKKSYKNLISYHPEMKSYKEYQFIVTICYNKPTEERGKYAYNIGFTLKNNIIIEIGVSSYGYMD